MRSPIQYNHMCHPFKFKPVPHMLLVLKIKIYLHICVTNIFVFGLFKQVLFCWCIRHGVDFWEVLPSVTRCHGLTLSDFLPNKKMWKVNHWQKPLVGSQIGLCWMVAVATGEDALLCNLGTSSLLTHLLPPFHSFHPPPLFHPPPILCVHQRQWCDAPICQSAFYSKWQ